VVGNKDQECNNPLASFATSLYRQRSKLPTCAHGRRKDFFQGGASWGFSQTFWAKCGEI